MYTLVKTKARPSGRQINCVVKSLVSLGPEILECTEYNLYL